MILVSVTRILDEDDIVEAFVRHNATFVDRMIFLDNGSLDRTLEILRALSDEGLPITVLQTGAWLFAEMHLNTMLYRAADRLFQPDWVLHLDCDEFIDLRHGDIQSELAAIPPEILCLQITLRNYFGAGVDLADLLVPRRCVMRDDTERGVWKCFVRGRLAGEVIVTDGNHFAYVDRQPAPSFQPRAITLAHYPDRHPSQVVVKAIIGRLKVLASGGGDQALEQRSHHYTSIFERIRDNPGELLRNEAFLAGDLPSVPLVPDPLCVRGGELRYTLPADMEMKATRRLMTAIERLARAHGALVDAHPAIGLADLTEALRPATIIG